MSAVTEAPPVVMLRTTRETTWFDPRSGERVDVPAGTEVRILSDAELADHVDRGEARALRECAFRMREKRQRPRYGLLDWVRVWGSEDFE